MCDMRRNRKLQLLLLVSLFLLADQIREASGSNVVKPSSRAVSSNQGSAVAKSNNLLMKGCPTQLFTFQSPSWQNYYYNGNGNGNNYFTSLIVGRGFVGDFRVCRYSTNQGKDYEYGFEQFNGQSQICNNGSVDLNRITNYYYSYEVLYVPKALNTAWVTHRSFPKFPTLSPAPISLDLSSSVTGYLARCRIVPNEGFDPSYTILIPGIVVPATGFSGSLTVKYNGNSYTCDQDDLEFPVCI